LLGSAPPESQKPRTCEEILGWEDQARVRPYQRGTAQNQLDISVSSGCGDVRRRRRGSSEQHHRSPWARAGEKRATLALATRRVRRSGDRRKVQRHQARSRLFRAQPCGRWPGAFDAAEFHNRPKRPNLQLTRLAHIHREVPIHALHLEVT